MNRTLERVPRGAGPRTSAPQAGQPRPGGRLARFQASDSPSHAKFAGDFAYVSVEGTQRVAVLNSADYLRLTADPRGPKLTRTRWWLDNDGLLRAYSTRDRPKEYGFLVAAAILKAKDGDVIRTPWDPLDLRRRGMHFVSTV